MFAVPSTSMAANSSRFPGTAVIFAICPYMRLGSVDSAGIAAIVVIAAPVIIRKSRRLNFLGGGGVGRPQKSGRESLILNLQTSLEEPMDAVFVRKMSVNSEGHLSQVVEQGVVCTHGELVKNCPQLFIGSSIKVHGYGIALPWHSRGMKPVRGR